MAPGGRGVASDAPRRLSSRVMKDRQKSQGESTTKSDPLRKDVLPRGERGMTHQVTLPPVAASQPRGAREIVSPPAGAMALGPLGEGHVYARDRKLKT